MTSAADLFGLQEIDLSRDSRRAQIADIELRLGEGEDLLAARELVVTAKADLDAARRRQREADAESKDLDAKIEPLEKKLYDGSIKNPKDLTDLQKEVDSHKARRSALDEAVLSIIETQEEATRNLATARERLAELEKRWKQELQELTATRDRARGEMESLEVQRQALAQGMDRALLALYDMLRTKRSGRAVARIERGTCQGCRLSLPTHIAQRARSAAAIVQCPSCERILVAG